MDQNGKATKYKDIQEILEKAKDLRGKKLSNLVFSYTEDKNKGNIGQHVETFFGLEINNKQEADFKAAGVDLELKVTPVRKLKNGEYSAKERLTLSMINFNDEFDDTFQGSKVFQKIKDTLVINYENTDGDKEFLESWLLNISDEELEIIEADYKKIISKIKSGDAHDLSEGDTVYLGAARKGHKELPINYKYGDTPAKKRAWSFKTKYMTRKAREVYNSVKVPVVKPIYSDSVIAEIKKLIGMSVIEINNSLSRKNNSKDKSKHRNALNAQLKNQGYDKNMLEENGVIIKAQIMNEDGMPQESMSFRNINFEEVSLWDFENTDLYDSLVNGFIYVRFSHDYKLLSVEKIDFTDEQINRAKEAFIKFREDLKNGKTEFIKEKDNLVIHVRPKAKDGKDTIVVNGKTISKQAFWINKDEIKFKK